MSRLVRDQQFAGWSFDGASTSFVFSDLTVDALAGEKPTGVILHIDLLWSPWPGRTPIDPTATNFICRMLILSNGEVGLYGGGGFCWPSTASKEGLMSIGITGSSLSLLEHSAGFKDLLTPAEIVGTLEANRDDAMVPRLRRAASQYVSNRLGAVNWVVGEMSYESLAAR